MLLRRTSDFEYPTSNYICCIAVSSRRFLFVPPKPASQFILTEPHLRDGRLFSAAADGNPNATSDALTGGALAWAGLRGALENVRINTKDGHPARARAQELSASAADALARLGLG